MSRLAPCAEKASCFAGSTKGASIDPQDLLTVRNCGVKMLENFRQQALQVGLSPSLLFLLAVNFARLNIVSLSFCVSVCVSVCVGC